MVAIFKNESHIMKEWLQHYILQGVDYFFLIDNGSNDNYMDAINTFADKIHLIIDPLPGHQTFLYNHHCLEKCKVFDWVMVCDLDEFMLARNGFVTIKEYLSTLNPLVSQIFVPWKIFGSNGFIKQPEKVVESFTKRKLYREDCFIETKCIVRTRFLIQFFTHSHSTIEGTIHMTSDGQGDNNIHPSKTHCLINETILDHSCLHLNHYNLQSLEWFTQVKMTRGDAANPDGNPRTLEYFYNYDKGETTLDLY